MTLSQHTVRIALSNFFLQLSTLSIFQWSLINLLYKSPTCRHLEYLACAHSHSSQSLCLTSCHGLELLVSTSRHSLIYIVNIRTLTSVFLHKYNYDPSLVLSPLLSLSTSFLISIIFLIYFLYSLLFLYFEYSLHLCSNLISVIQFHIISTVYLSCVSVSAHLYVATLTSTNISKNSMTKNM